MAQVTFGFWGVPGGGARPLGLTLYHPGQGSSPLFIWAHQLSDVATLLGLVCATCIFYGAVAEFFGIIVGLFVSSSYWPKLHPYPAFLSHHGCPDAYPGMRDGS